MPTPELKKGDLFRFVQSRRKMEEVVDRRFGELHEELKIKIPDPAKKFFDDTWYDDKVNWYGAVIQGVFKRNFSADSCTGFGAEQCAFADDYLQEFLSALEQLKVIWKDQIDVSVQRHSLNSSTYVLTLTVADVACQGSLPLLTQAENQMKQAIEQRQNELFKILDSLIPESLRWYFDDKDQQGWFDELLINAFERNVFDDDCFGHGDPQEGYFPEDYLCEFNSNLDDLQRAWEGLVKIEANSRHEGVLNLQMKLVQVAE